MGDKQAEILRKLKELASKYGPTASVLAVVESVNEDEGTCVLKDDEATYNDVRLHVVLDGTESQYVVPAVNSYALAIKIEGDNDWVLFAASAIDKWRLSIGEAAVEQTASGLLIKKGNDVLRDALVALVEGVEQVVVIQGTNPNYAKLAEAKTKIKNILSNAS